MRACGVRVGAAFDGGVMRDTAHLNHAISAVGRVSQANAGVVEGETMRRLPGVEMAATLALQNFSLSICFFQKSVGRLLEKE